MEYFWGYARNHAGDAYRMLNPSTNKVWITRDVTWLNQQYHEHNHIKNRVILLDLDDERLQNNQRTSVLTLPTPRAESGDAEATEPSNDNDNTSTNAPT